MAIEDSEAEIERDLEETERLLFALKERYARVKEDKQRKLQLQEWQRELEGQTNNPTGEPIKTELRRIQEELAKIEMNLESSLLTWSSFKEPFWQAVRFGGIGMVIGWILKSRAG